VFHRFLAVIDRVQATTRGLAAGMIEIECYLVPLITGLWQSAGKQSTLSVESIEGGSTG
jgi:hypothetical protein